MRPRRPRAWRACSLRWGRDVLTRGVGNVDRRRHAPASPMASRLRRGRDRHRRDLGEQRQQEDHHRDHWRLHLGRRDVRDDPFLDRSGVFRNRRLTNVQVAASNNNTFAGGGLRQRRLRLGRTKREQFLDCLLGPWHSFIQWRWCGRRRGRFPALAFRTTFPRARAERAGGAHPLEMDRWEPTTHSWAGQASFRNRGLTNVQVAGRGRRPQATPASARSNKPRTIS
jgi:hypothetical protein